MQKTQVRQVNPWVGKIPWRRKWQPIPVFHAGKFLGQRSLAVYSPWDRKKLDTTEVTEHTQRYGVDIFLIFTKLSKHYLFKNLSSSQ